jgi:hypothetical protein
MQALEYKSHNCYSHRWQQEQQQHFFRRHHPNSQSQHSRPGSVGLGPRLRHFAYYHYNFPYPSIRYIPLQFCFFYFTLSTYHSSHRLPLHFNHFFTFAIHLSAAIPWPTVVDWIVNALHEVYTHQSTLVFATSFGSPSSRSRSGNLDANPGSPLVLLGSNVVVLQSCFDPT